MPSSHPQKATKKKKTPGRRQPDDFVSVARRLEADEDKERFEKVLGKIAKAKPQDRKKPI
jgi:hypothetical protein